MSIQYHTGLTFLLIAVVPLVCGVFYLLLPRWRARLSFVRLFYRILMWIRKKPVQPPSKWRLRWIRFVGILGILLGCFWLAQLQPRVYWLSSPLCDPTARPWQVENGNGAPDEQRVIAVLDTLTKSRIQPDSCVGTCIGVLCEGKTYTLGLGRKTMGRKEAPDADTEFEIGSITKVITGTALASLVESGKATLEEPVSALLPPDWRMHSYPGKAITLKDLATHRSGLPRMPDVPAKGAVLDLLFLKSLHDPYRNMTPEYVREFLSEYTLPRAPGAKDEYSNLGGGLLGYALSQRAQQPYAEMIQQRIFGPLGMNDTAVRLNPEQTARLAQGYMGPYKLGPLYIALPMPRWRMTEAFQGCGGVASTVHDLLKYVAAQMAAPEGPLGPALARVQTPLYDTGGIPNCKTGLMLMGWNLDGLDGPMYWHNGGTGGYCAFMGYSKQHRVGVVMLASGASDEKLCREIIKALAKESRG